jgi:hypothetical protein
VHAGLLKIELSSENVQLGDTVELKIIATNFDNFDTFNFSLGFDNTIFDYSAISFMSDLLNSNPFSFYDVNTTSSGLAFSFLDFSPVLSGDVVLASFELKAKNYGASSFSMSDVEFYAPFPSTDMLSVDSSSTANANSVPEPSIMFLLFFGLLALIRKNINNQKID